MILAGDVGGTKTLLEVGTLDATGAGSRRSLRATPPPTMPICTACCAVFAGWDGAGRSHDALTGACFGVAGPVFDNRAQMTNLPWVVDGARDRRRVRHSARAASSTISPPPPAASNCSQAADLVHTAGGRADRQAPRLVIGAGTGLGVAHLVWAGGRYQVVAGEAGHAGFAPATHRAVRTVARSVCARGRVTVEHVVSGPGLRAHLRIHPRASGRCGAQPTLRRR